jgi:hypothetical protein
MREKLLLRLFCFVVGSPAAELFFRRHPSGEKEAIAGRIYRMVVYVAVLALSPLSKAYSCVCADSHILCEPTRRKQSPLSAPQSDKLSIGHYFFNRPMGTICCQTFALLRQLHALPKSFARAGLEFSSIVLLMQSAGVNLCQRMACVQAEFRTGHCL